jgi:histidine phosphotransfer protein HptB
MKAKICDWWISPNYVLLILVGHCCGGEGVLENRLGVVMIDWGRVCELRDEIGADDFAEVVQLFLEETEKVVKALGDDKSAEAVESGLHFLKGSALSLGFRDLAALCQTGEKAAATGRSDAIDLGLVAIVYERSKAAFAAGQRDMNAA